MNQILDRVMAEAQQTANHVGYAVDVYQIGASNFCIIAHGVQVERGVLVATVNPA